MSFNVPNLSLKIITHYLFKKAYPWSKLQVSNVWSSHTKSAHIYYYLQDHILLLFENNYFPKKKQLFYVSIA